MKKKKVLVYPCGTEIGLEIYRSVSNSIHFELYGGSSNYDHGQFVYEKHISNLPFITDYSDIKEIKEFNQVIKDYKIDYIYPAMDGVLYKFAEFAEVFDCEIIAPNFETTSVTRSKLKTYELLKDDILVPKIFSDLGEIKNFPIFIKPDVGQGSVGAKRINSHEELSACQMDGMIALEYLPGAEYTIDCFTNNEGELIFSGARGRKRIKGGISVNAVSVVDKRFQKMAHIINDKLEQRGGWFFQVKIDENDEFSLLEISSRIGGSSGYSRCLGVNLPLLTLFIFDGNEIDYIDTNKYNLVLDRALYNTYATDLEYKTVYLDYDDTVVINNEVNIQIISFVYQCVNREISVILLTKHIGNLEKDLEQKRLLGLFDEIIHLERDENKVDYIVEKNSIFIDDSFGERNNVLKNKGIPVFDTHMVEMLINPLKLEEC